MRIFAPLCGRPRLFIQEVEFDVDAAVQATETNINKWVKRWTVITGSPSGYQGNTAQMPKDEAIALWASRSLAVVEKNLKMLTPAARMFPLACGCGKRSYREPLIVARLGHPLRCLAVASCGSNAAKGLRKHSARSAGLPKSTYVGTLCFLLAADMSKLDGCVAAWAQGSRSLSARAWPEATMRFIWTKVGWTCTLKTSLKKFALAQPCREIQTKILPWAKINLNLLCSVSSKHC